MLRRALPLLVLVALLLSPGASAWSQYRGTAARTSADLLPDGPLDVAARFDLLDQGAFHGLDGSPAVLTPLGVVGFAADGARCRALAFPDASPPARVLFEVEDCAGYIGFGRSLQAYDAARERLLLCIAGPGDSPVLRAHDLRTGEVAWSLAPAALGLTPEGASARWLCQGGALDPATSMLFLVFISFPFDDAGVYSSYHRIAAVDLETGGLRWASSVPAEGVAPLLPTSVEDFLPRGVTLTSTGVVVVGRTSMNAGRWEATLAFFDRDGGYHGSLRAERGSPLSPSASIASRTRAGAFFPVAHGPVAATHLGGDVVVVNPEIGSVVARAPVRAFDTSSEYAFWPTGAWMDDVILVLLPHAVSALDATTLETLWSWSEGADFLVREVVTSATGEAHLVVGREGDRESLLVTLEGTTGDVLAKLPIPLPPEPGIDNVWPINVLPVPDRGILVFDESGRAILAGPGNASRAPRIAPSTAYPPAGGRVEIPLAAGDGLVRYVVAWGDGAIEDVEPGATAGHAYPRAGRQTLRVTAVFTDGLTATSVASIDVGATPPPELTALQKAFAPENENFTFGILGIAITVLGAAVTIGRARARFARLERELAAVEEIRLLSTSDPRAAVLALKAYRERLPADLARGRIDDSQYHVLDLRSARLLKVLRTRMVAPYDGRLSARYHRQLDAAFEDAILQPAEADALVAALEAEEAMGPDDRAAMRGLLADFTTTLSR